MEEKVASVSQLLWVHSYFLDILVLGFSSLQFLVGALSISQTASPPVEEILHQR